MNNHKLNKEVSTEINGKWVPAIPYPYFSTKGLPIWKRFNKANWRPQCTCKRVFDTLEDYHAHIVFMNSPYAAVHLDSSDMARTEQLS